jgi:hypothetical protein
MIIKIVDKNININDNDPYSEENWDIGECVWVIKRKNFDKYLGFAVKKENEIETFERFCFKRKKDHSKIDPYGEEDWDDEFMKPPKSSDSELILACNVELEIGDKIYVYNEDDNKNIYVGKIIKEEILEHDGLTYTIRNGNKFSKYPAYMFWQFKVKKYKPSRIQKFKNLFEK